MMTWILTILHLEDRLEAAAARLDDRIAAVALNPFGDTMRQCERLMRLNDRKRRLVNMQVLSHRLRCCMKAEEAALLRLLHAGVSYGDLAQALGVSKATAYRRVKCAAAKCVRELEKLGFTPERLRREYADVNAVKTVYDAFCARAAGAG